LPRQTWDPRFWYAEGGRAAYTQAEIEYKDFQTFFPTWPKRLRHSIKLLTFTFRKWKKPDRDYTHALRAEDEYRQMILQYPDSKLLLRPKSGCWQSARGFR